MTDTPCKECTERHINCHTYCDKYKAFKAKTEARRILANRNKYLDRITFNEREDKYYWREKKLQTQGRGKYSK